MLRCTGCGSTETIEEIRAKHPNALACCPERNMQPEPYVRVPVEPGNKQLKVFGYAPGDYMSTCLGCGQSKVGLDKRASSCRECAERRYKRIILECAES